MPRPAQRAAFLARSAIKRLMRFEPSYKNVLQIYALGAVALFLPFVLNTAPQIEYSSHLIPAITADQYHNSQLVMLTVSLTLLTEALLDAKCDFKLASCRLTLLFALLVPSALSLACTSFSDVRKTQLFICCFEWRNSLVVGALLAAMVEIKNSKQSKWFLLIASIISQSCFQYWCWEPFLPQTELASWISVALNIIFLLVIIGVAISSVQFLNREGNMFNANLSVEDKYTVIFSFSLVLNFCVKFGTFFVYETESWSDIQLGEILIFCGCDVAFGVVAFIVTMRIERERAAIAKVRQQLASRQAEISKNLLSCASSLLVDLI